MKLKTLKDLYTQDEDELMRNIKQEAIKWIKFLDTPLGLDWDAFDLRNFWLNRFNITEDDLKVTRASK